MNFQVVGDGLHWVVLWGVDVVGNVQEKGFNYTWLLDTTAPTVELLRSESLSAATKETSLTFTVQRSEANATVWWAVDSTGWTELLNTESSFMANVGGDGTHVLRLKSADVLGNQFVNSTAWQWILDTASPTSRVSQGPKSPSVSSSAEFLVECTSSSPGGAPGSDCVGYEFTVAVALSSGCGSLETHRGQVNASGFVRVIGIRSGENTLTVSAVDGVGLKQVNGATFSWTAQLTSDILDVAIVSGPPETTAWKVATFQLYAHKNGTRSTAARFEVKLDDAPWSEGSVFCNASLCNYSTPALPLAPHDIQIRAKDVVTGVAGAPALWRWTVAECAPTEYADVDHIGTLNCTGCPLGGNCSSKGTTVDTIMAQPGWWSPPGDGTAHRRRQKTAVFYQCKLPGSEYPSFLFALVFLKLL